MSRLSGKASINFNRGIHFKLFGILVIAGWLGSLASVPYVLTLIGTPPIPMEQLLLLIALQTLLQLSLITGLGLGLANQVGLGAPIVKGWLAGEPDVFPQLQAFLPLSIAGGLGIGAINWLLDKLIFAHLLPAAFHEVATPSPWQGFLASFSGGITEELMLRLGLMSCLVWLGSKLTQRKPPNSAVLWIAIILTALIFGIGHLPITAQLVPLSPIVVTRALWLNGIPGLFFGWLYWRKGLEAAMIPHFSCDICLHVIAAF